MHDLLVDQPVRGRRRRLRKWIRADPRRAIPGALIVLAIVGAVSIAVMDRNSPGISDGGDVAKVASLEQVEVQARTTSASLAPGSCGTVAYTPVTARRGQVGELCLPGQQTHTTVIVLVHGGGGMGGSRTDLAAWQRGYSELGYVTFSIDYRLNDPEADDGVWPLPEQNLKAAIQFMRQASSTLGTEKIVVQGHSSGARLGGVILTTPNDSTFRGPDLWTSVSDAADGFVGFYGYYNGFQFEWDSYFGTGADRPTASDACGCADRASGPALLITGSSDSMVDPNESDHFATALAEAGRDAKVVKLDGRNHGFDQHDDALTADGERMLELIQSWITDHVETHVTGG